MKTTVEKNRMLLDFMGEKPGYNSFTGKYDWSDTPWFTCSYATEEEVMDAVAKYNSDWNWLMKVVDKLCHLRIGDGEVTVDYAHPYTFGAISEDGKVMVRLNGFPVHLADTLIEATYEAVCEAVEHILENDVKLLSTDYVLWDKANDTLFKDSQSHIIIYGSREEAEEDCCGNETVTSTTELPEKLQVILLKQIKDSML